MVAYRHMASGAHFGKIVIRVGWAGRAGHPTCTESTTLFRLHWKPFRRL